MPNSTENKADFSPQVAFEAAIALQESGDFQGAVRQYEALLRKIPDHPQILSMCGLANAELGNLQDAQRFLERAVTSAPTYADAWLNLGKIRQKAGDLPGASEAYGRFVDLNPRSPLGHVNLGNVRQLEKRFDDALPAYEQALNLAPADPYIWSNYARAALYAGNWEQSLQAANRALSLSSGHTGAMSVKSAALLELGRDEELCDLVDFDRFIAVRDLTPPAEYASLEDFNTVLCAHCQAHPSLVYEPSEKTTKKGHQTSNLSKDEDPGPVGQLLELIGGAVCDYQRARPTTATHPFLANPPERWNYDIWATILGSQGHQAPHIHRSGWLSGCYYAKIPDVVTADAKDQAGWIEFGRPQQYPHAKATPKIRSFQPREGMLVLFPSYFYHRTIPFDSQEKRISIAFDIVPAE